MFKLILPFAIAFLMAGGRGAVAQQCPPNSHVDRVVQDGNAQTIHCKCDSGFENRVGECQKVGAVKSNTREQAASIGSAGAITGNVWIIGPNGRRMVVQPGMTLRLNDEIETGSTGRVQVQLSDETVFTIGPSTKMVLDRFVYDPGSGPVQITARILKGVFRFTSGLIARKRSYDIQIHGPVGCFCIRGTDFEAESKPDESGFVKVYSGEVLLKNKKTGNDTIVTSGTIVLFDAKGAVKGPMVFN